MYCKYVFEYKDGVPLEFEGYVEDKAIYSLVEEFKDVCIDDSNVAYGRLQANTSNIVAKVAYNGNGFRSLITEIINK